MEKQVNLSLDKTTEIVCDNCDNNVFIESILLRKASRFMTGTAQDAIIPIPVFSCTSCGSVNKEFLPIALKNQDNG